MGGNVFKNTSPILKERIEPTLTAYYAEINRLFPDINFHFMPVGSTGKKDISGDIDLAVNENIIFSAYSVNPSGISELFNIFKRKAKTATSCQLTIRATLTAIANFINNDSDLIEVNVQKIYSNMFSVFPQYDKNGKTDQFVQIDWLVGNIKWLKFSYYNDALENNIKGLHRTQLIVSLFQAKGYSFSHSNGITEKSSGKLVATTPQESIKVLNNIYGFNITEKILENYFLIQEFLEKNVDTVTKEEIYNIYLKILDHTKCDIPFDLQNYWLLVKDKLNLTGKFLSTPITF